jgi:hypothetical protein
VACNIESDSAWWSTIPKQIELVANNKGVRFIMVSYIMESDSSRWYSTWP